MSSYIFWVWWNLVFSIWLLNSHRPIQWKEHVFIKFSNIFFCTINILIFLIELYFILNLNVNKKFRIGSTTMNVLFSGQFQRRPTSTDRLISDDHDNLVSIKVQIFWEGRKNLRNYLVNVQTMRRIAQNSSKQSKILRFW